MHMYWRLDWDHYLLQVMKCKIMRRYYNYDRFSTCSNDLMTKKHMSTLHRTSLHISLTVETLQKKLMEIERCKDLAIKMESRQEEESGRIYIILVKHNHPATIHANKAEYKLLFVIHNPEQTIQYHNNLNPALSHKQSNCGNLFIWTRKLEKKWGV